VAAHDGLTGSDVRRAVNMHGTISPYHWALYSAEGARAIVNEGFHPVAVLIVSSFSIGQHSALVTEIFSVYIDDFWHIFANYGGYLGISGHP